MEKRPGKNFCGQKFSQTLSKNLIEKVNNIFNKKCRESNMNGVCDINVGIR
jgi:hypothetical protein